MLVEPDKKHVESLLKETGMESCISSPSPFITENAIFFFFSLHDAQDDTDRATHNVFSLAQELSLRTADVPSAESVSRPC